MRPIEFRIERPVTLTAALAALAIVGDPACVLAGGQSLLKQLRDRVIAPPRIVDISGLADLAYIKRPAAGLEIGALTTLAMIASDPLVAAHCPALATAARRVGDVQIRGRATVGGNLLSGWSGDLGVVLAAVRATVELASQRGLRTLAIDELLSGSVEIHGDELIRALVIPDTLASAFDKLSRRAADPVLVSVAIAVWRTHEQLEIGCAAGGVHQHPVRLVAVEQAIANHGLKRTTFDAALIADLKPLQAPDTPHAGSAYRLRVLPVMVMRVLTLALAGKNFGDWS